MKTIVATIFLLVFFGSGVLAGEIGCELVPPDHWAYPALERFEALGLCRLPATRPFTRNQIEDFVGLVEDNVSARAVDLSPRDRYELSRLAKEFYSREARTNPVERYDPPSVFLSDEPLFLEGDLEAALAPRKEFFDDRTEFFLTGAPNGKIHYGDHLTYSFRYLLAFGPEYGDRARNMKPSPREKSFKGLTSLFEISSIVLHSSRVDLVLGRDYADWGPASDGNLVLSREAGSLDNLTLEMTIRNLRFTIMQALLSPGDRRRLSAHRLELEAGRFLFGLSESVVYVGRGLDPVYAFPLSSFYANQFNERGDDNILWGVDAKIRLGGTVLYGGLLIDDFQFERNGDAPDKIAFNLGGRFALARPLSCNLLLSYSRADIYTFTHRDSMKSYVAGGGQPGQGDRLLGGGVGPDSDRLSVAIETFPRPNLIARISSRLTRRGEGSDFRKFLHGMDVNPRFPSGVVEKIIDLRLGAVWELDGGSSFSFEWAWEKVKNRAHAAGTEERSTAFDISLLLDF
jgi:hypothetical protein